MKINKQAIELKYINCIFGNIVLIFPKATHIILGSAPNGPIKLIMNIVKKNPIPLPSLLKNLKKSPSYNIIDIVPINPKITLDNKNPKLVNIYLSLEKVPATKG
jgi:hypothetical protein